jgi:hypothetical protein
MREDVIALPRGEAVFRSVAEIAPFFGGIDVVYRSDFMHVFYQNLSHFTPHALPRIF